MPEPDASPGASRFDPTFLNARREAGWILVAWAVCLLWTVGYSAWAGYGVEAAHALSFILGIPAWVFWGVLVPWLAATLFSVWFGLAFIADDDLGDADDEEAPHA